MGNLQQACCPGDGEHRKFGSGESNLSSQLLKQKNSKAEKYISARPHMHPVLEWFRELEHQWIGYVKSLELGLDDIVKKLDKLKDDE